MLSGIFGAALLGLGITARSGPRTGYPEIMRHDLLRVANEVKQTGESFVLVRDPWTSVGRKVVVRSLGPGGGARGSYRSDRITNIRYRRPPKDYPFNEEKDDLFHTARKREAIFVDPNLDLKTMVSVLRHEIVHASDPSLVLQRGRKSNSFYNYFFSKEEVKARLAQIDFEIRTHPDFIRMKEYCNADLRSDLVDFDESSGELVYRNSIIYRTEWGEKCDPDYVPISKLISLSLTADETLTPPIQRRASKGYGQVPIPRSVMKAVGALLANLQQEVRDSRWKRIRQEALDHLRDRRKRDLGSPPAARFVRKRPYRT